MNWLELIHSYRENSIDLGDQTFLMAIQMFRVIGQNSNHVFDLFLTHGFHNESLVGTKEEKAARGSSSKSCI
jgi:hypothetical protein